MAADAPTTAAERITLAVCALGLSIIVFAMLGFGAKSVCTSTGDRPACDPPCSFASW